MSPMSGSGSCAGLRARFSLPSARPGVGRRTPPPAPATHSRWRKTTGAGLPPAHPGRSPTSSTLAREEGFTQRAHAGARRARSGQAWGGAQTLVPPRAHSAGLGRAKACGCCRTAPSPRPAGCYLPGAPDAAPGGASRAGGVACQGAEFRVPSA